MAVGTFWWTMFDEIRFTCFSPQNTTKSKSASSTTSNRSLFKFCCPWSVIKQGWIHKLYRRATCQHMNTAPGYKQCRVHTDKEYGEYYHRVCELNLISQDNLSEVIIQWECWFYMLRGTLCSLLGFPRLFQCNPSDIIITQDQPTDSRTNEGKNI